MASEIRVDKINSLSGVGTVTLSPTGVDIAGITTAATLRATTGIVTSLTAGSLTSLGAVSGTTGTFTGAVSGTTGTFTGDVDIADTIVHTGDTNTKIRFPAADTITAETGGSERARIDSSGNLLVGTTSAAGRFCVQGAAGGVALQTTDATNSTFRISHPSSGVNLLAGGSSQHLALGTGFAEKLRIDSGGRTLIGTTTQNNNAKLQVTTDQQVVATFEGTGSSDPQIYLGDDMSSPTNNCVIMGYDKADNRGYLTVGGDADTTLTINDGSLIGVNTNVPVEHFGVAGNIRFVNPTGTTRRINALPSGTYNVGSSGGSAIAFHRVSDGGGGSDEIAFETHWQGNRHAESARISKFGGITFNGDTAAANALDDYEEGTYTPTDGSGAGLSLTNNTTARYTKIGRMMYIQFDITWPSNSNAATAGFSLPTGLGMSISYGTGVIGWTDYGKPLFIHIGGFAYIMDNNSSIGNSSQHTLNSEISGKRLIGNVWYIS